MRDSSPGREGPSSHRDRDRDEDEDHCGRIVAAANLFERLGLREAATEPAEVRKAYRSIALRVHPDKNSDRRATEAFQLLSEAFDTLHSKSSQQAYLQRAQIGSRSKGKKEQKRKWYQRRSWEDIERHLRQREVAEAALRQSFVSSLRNKFHDRKARQQLAQAERTAYDLDEKAGFDSDYAPGSSEDGASEVARPSSGEAVMTSLNEVLMYLRDAHCYCMYCGIKYVDGSDLDRNCPGFSEESHEDGPEAALDDDEAADWGDGGLSGADWGYTGEMDY